MQRFLYFAGFVYIALCGTFVASQVATGVSSMPRGFEVPVDPHPVRPAPARATVRIVTMWRALVDIGRRLQTYPFRMMDLGRGSPRNQWGRCETLLC